MKLRRKVKLEVDTTAAVRTVTQLHGVLLTLPHSVSIPVHHRTLRSRLRAAWSAFNR